MNNRNTRHNFVLEAWIARATKDIIPSEQDRLAAEFREHYDAAYEEALDAGADSAAAQDTAMGQLGKAWKVRRQLRKHYLTQREWNWLQGVCQPLGSLKGTFHYFAFWYLCFIMHMLVPDRYEQPEQLPFLLLLAVPAMVYSLGSKLGQKNTIAVQNAKTLAKRLSIHNAITLTLLLPWLFTISYPICMEGSHFKLIILCINPIVLWFIFVYTPFAMQHKLAKDTMLEE